MTEELFEVKGMKKYFSVTGGMFSQIFQIDGKFVHAVDDIDFSIKKGEILCLVGESGCGKTTTARVVAGLEEPTGGKFIWKGREIHKGELKPRIDDVKSQIVFQNPYSSLNPRMKVGDAVQHPLVIHDRIKDPKIKQTINRAYFSEIFLLISLIIAFGFFISTFIFIESQITKTLNIIALIAAVLGLSVNFYFGSYKRNKIVNEQVIEMLEKVGLSPPLQYYKKYPHEISGGERQRVNIARSIILKPELLILDEPTSMLDVSLRAGILDLLRELQKELDISILLITHDLGTARHFSDRVGVMYVGEIVETGEVDDLFRKPLHPYTHALVNAIPSITPRESDFELPSGDVADAVNPPSGCRYHPRCPYAQEKCKIENPRLNEILKDRYVACHFPLVE